MRCSFDMRVGGAAFAVALACVGCPRQDLAPLGPCTVSAVSERVDQAGVSNVDLLFVIDNSGSMASEQQKVARELPRLVEVLTTGDRCAGGNEETCTLDDQSTPKRHFTAVKELHLGVVSVNMGGIDAPTGTQAGVVSCKGLGDDGKLQTSVQIAVDGVTAGRKEFTDYDEGEVIISPDPDCDIGDQPRYQEYVATAKGADPAAIARNFSCVARLGVRGCSFEQQLEAMWKALAPASGDGPADNYKFLNGTEGHGDGYNKGFLRDDAILAVIEVSDEDDCSITDEGKVLFSQSSDAERAYGFINLRCGLAAKRDDVDTLIWNTDRYVSGLLSLKPDNKDRIIYGAIVGIPEDADNLSPEEILALPQMQFAPSPIKPTVPTPSCIGMTGDKVDEAYPGRRYMQVAAGFGANAVVYSICKDDYAPALDTLIGKIASKLKGNCLPRRLNPDASGKVSCQVFELLNSADAKARKCYPERGHKDKTAVDLDVRESGAVVSKPACLMKQVPVDNQIPEAGARGWYYDNFSPELRDDCAEGEQQRIQFQFATGAGTGTADLPAGAVATIECFQPVARIDNDAKGLEAVNTSCALGKELCDQRIDKEGDGYALTCIEASKTCQIACKANPDCPPGWVCDVAAGDPKADKIKYCQLPTCPADSSAATSGGT